jgi:hypothetical protein
MFACGSARTAEVGSLRFDDLAAQDAAVLTSIAAEQIDAGFRRAPAAASTPDAHDAPARITAVLRWLEARLPAGPWPDETASWSRADAAEVPYWCWFCDGAALFVPLGLDGCLDIDTVCAVVTQAILDSSVGSVLARSSAGPNHADFRKPVVRVAAGGEIWPIGRIQVLAHRLVMKSADLHSRAAEIDRFVSGLAPWLGTPRPSPAGAGPEVSIVAGGDGATWEVVFDDVLAHEHEDLVAAFVRDVRRAAGVHDARHEDREVVVVHGGAGTGERLVSFTSAWWQERLPQIRVEGPIN